MYRAFQIWVVGESREKKGQGGFDNNNGLSDIRFFSKQSKASEEVSVSCVVWVHSEKYFSLGSFRLIRVPYNLRHCSWIYLLAESDFESLLFRPVR